MTSKPSDKTYIILILLFVVTGAISWNLYFKVYRQEDTVDIHQFPKTIGEWSSEELPITDEEYAILETKNAFARKYVHSSGQAVYVFIVYSQNNRKVSHPPEVCYQGTGITVVSTAHDAISNPAGNTMVKVNKLVLEQKYYDQVAFYWFKVGDTFTSNYWKQQMMIVLNSLLGKPSSSALIRISAIMEGEDTAKSAQQLKDFGQLMIPHLYTYLP